MNAGRVTTSRCSGVLLLMALFSLGSCGQDRPLHSRLADDDANHLEDQLSAVSGIQPALEQFVSEKMQRHHIPGVAIGIVRIGKQAWAQGFGKRSNASTDSAVNENTLFAIGSISKSFTALNVGRLVDAGVVDWDTPVREYYPALRFYDETATAQVNFVDLMTHRTGLPRHDLVWYGRHTTGPQAVTRTDLVKAVRWLEPSIPFRSGWQYQNLMFNVSGFVTEQVTGKSWEEQLRSELLAPLGMTRTNFSVTALEQDENSSRAFVWSGEGEPKIVPYRNLEAIGPAGSINSSAAEMNRYLEMLLNGGSVNGNAIVSTTTLATITGPHSVIDRDRGHPAFSYLTYGLGWMVYQYRGKSVVSHGGAIDGFKANVMLLPDDGIGIVVLTNAGHRNVSELISLRAADLMLGLDPIDFDPAPPAGPAAPAADAPPAATSGSPAAITLTPPTGRPLADYVGRYSHPAYGLVDIKELGPDNNSDPSNPGKLAVTLNALDPAEIANRNRHDAFFFGKERPEPGVDSNKILFLSDFDGVIDRLSWPLESLVSPIEFKKTR